MNTLTNALPIVAAAYGRKFNVPVQVGGDQACTDGETIRIPTIPDQPSGRTLAYGYLAHEAAHVRFTDFDLIRNPTPLGRFIEGVLEDIRIEQAIIRTYPGTQKTLDAVIDHMVATGAMSPVTESDSPSIILGNGLLALVRSRYRQQTALGSHAQTAEQVMRKVLGSRFVCQLNGLLTEIPSLTSTADSMALTQRILELVEDEAQQPQEEQPQPQEEQSEPDESSKSDTSQTQPQQEEQSQPEDEQQQGKGTESQAEAESTSEQSDNGQPEDGADTEAGDGSQPQGTKSKDQAQSALNQVLAADEDELPEDVFEAVAEALSAQSTPAPMLLPTAEHYAGDQQQGRTALHRVKVHSAKLTARLQGLVQAHAQTRHRTVRHGRTLSPSHLHRAALGDPRIFRVKDQKVAPNTALHLLVDLSGSMARGQDCIALDAAMALALALEPIHGVSRAVSAFPGRHRQDTQVTRLLGHTERVASHAGAFVQRARGGTPMTGALWFAAANLLARSEDRKVLLTLTDGVPNDVPSALDLINRAVQAGIECIGIGIQTNVSGLFPVAIRIDHIGDLKGQLFHITERLLLK